MTKDLRAERRMKNGKAIGRISRFFAERNARAEGRAGLTFEDETGIIAADIRGGRRFLPFLCTGLAIGIFGGVVWYAYGGIGSQEMGALPVIAAQGGETKVRPMDEGGLEIPHRDKAILNPDLSTAEAQAVEHLLPLPEEPEPLQTAASPAAPETVEPATATQVAEVETASPEPSIDEVLATLGSQAPLETAAPSSETSSSETPSSGTPSSTGTQSAQLPTKSGYILQLAAVRDKSNIEQEWARLKQTFPDLLGDQKLVIEEADVSGKTYYRIQTGPFPTKATAEDVCAQLKTQKQPCILKKRSD